MAKSYTFHHCRRFRFNPSLGEARLQQLSSNYAVKTFIQFYAVTTKVSFTSSNSSSLKFSTQSLSKELKKTMPREREIFYSIQSCMISCERRRDWMEGWCFRKYEKNVKIAMRCKKSSSRRINKSTFETVEKLPSVTKGRTSPSMPWKWCCDDDGKIT